LTIQKIKQTIYAQIRKKKLPSLDYFLYRCAAKHKY
jgi:hypothetical protein